MTFLLFLICVYLACKSWAAANVPAASAEEQRMRAERQTARNKQLVSLAGTGIAWLVGKGLNARKL